jgi:hypothetical protein
MYVFILLNLKEVFLRITAIRFWAWFLLVP